MAPPLLVFEEMRVQVHFMYYVVCSLYGCSVLIFNHFPSTSWLPLALSVPHAHNITLGAHTHNFSGPTMCHHQRVVRGGLSYRTLCCCWWKFFSSRASRPRARCNYFCRSAGKWRVIGVQLNYQRALPYATNCAEEKSSVCVCARTSVMWVRSGSSYRDRYFLFCLFSSAACWLKSQVPWFFSFV